MTLTETIINKIDVNKIDDRTALGLTLLGIFAKLPSQKKEKGFEEFMQLTNQQTIDKRKFTLFLVTGKNNSSLSLDPSLVKAIDKNKVMPGDMEKILEAYENKANQFQRRP